MLGIERKNLILSILNEEKKVLVSDLSSRFGVSEETIRRDLDKLETEGFVIKVYGGAVLNDKLSDFSFDIRKQTNVLSKKIIADLAKDLIEDGDYISLDASSTAFFIAKSIKNKKNLTVITNSIVILLEFYDISGWRIISTGGVLSENSLALVGNNADKTVASFQVGKSFISCKGIEARKGLTDFDEEHASIKKTMLFNAEKRILALDSSKFDRIAFTKICDLKGIDIIITEQKPNEKWLELFAENGVECIYPKQNSDQAR